MEANCSECGNPIEYTPKQANTLVECPHCGATTGLPRIPKPPMVNRKAKLWLLTAVFGIPLLALAIVAFFKLVLPVIRERTVDWGSVSQAIGILCSMAAISLAACLALAWLLLPVIVWVKLDALIEGQRKQTDLLRHQAGTRIPDF